MEYSLERNGFMGRASLGKAVAIVMVVIFAGTSCTTISENPKTAIGGLGGATVGGLIAGAAGAGGAGIAAGVIGGALLGGLVGNFLDDRDKRIAAESAHRALEDGAIRPQCRVDQSGQWALRNSHSRSHVPVGRHVLPRVSADRDHRRQAGALLRDSLPPARWHLEDRRLI